MSYLDNKVKVYRPMMGVQAAFDPIFFCAVSLLI